MQEPKDSDQTGEKRLPYEAPLLSEFDVSRETEVGSRLGPAEVTFMGYAYTPS